MHFDSLLAVLIYGSGLILISYFSHKRNQSSRDFVLGDRKMNPIVTALSAHVSDMSSWIFLAYPSVIFAKGLNGAWIAIGLCSIMLLNWIIVAPRLRVSTEKLDSLTLPSFFESHFRDHSGTLRIITLLISLVFYTVYISGGIVGVGLLLEKIFGIDFTLAAIIGTSIIIPYLLVSGYITLAWTDLFQGTFLLFTILLVPIMTLKNIGFNQLLSISTQPNYQPLLPNYHLRTIIESLFSMLGWGLGYFGLPHIVTKFMGIKDVNRMQQSRWIGVTWQATALLGATLVGLVAMLVIKNIDDPQLVFVQMTNNLFPTFLSTLLLCAIIGATITSVDAMILVISSNISEDFYKRTLDRYASSSRLILVSRISILCIALTSLAISLSVSSNILSLVSYAWFGLGGSFGPLVIMSLFCKQTNKYGALSGLVLGSIFCLIWPFINSYITDVAIPTSIPGFLIGFATIWSVSKLTRKLP